MQSPVGILVPQPAASDTPWHTWGLYVVVVVADVVVVLLAVVVVVAVVVLRVVDVFVVYVTVKLFGPLTQYFAFPKYAQSFPQPQFPVFLHE